MTKEEAIQAMLDGKKVTHRFFMDDEYMFLCDKINNVYQFEDGVEIDAQKFWGMKMENIEDWEEDWEIFEEKK